MWDPCFKTSSPFVIMMIPVYLPRSYPTPRRINRTTAGWSEQEETPGRVCVLSTPLNTDATFIPLAVVRRAGIANRLQSGKMVTVSNHHGASRVNFDLFFLYPHRFKRSWGGKRFRSRFQSPYLLVCVLANKRPKMAVFFRAVYQSLIWNMRKENNNRVRDATSAGSRMYQKINKIKKK